MPPPLTEFHKRRKRRGPIPSASFAAAAWSASSAKKGVKTNRKRGWDSEMECPLYFRRENYREMRENREQKWSVPRKPLLHSQKVLPKGIPPCPSRPESLGDRGLSLSLSSYPPRLYKTCESLYGLFILVRTVRVVRGSWNSKGVSAINLTAKHAKIANKEGSVSRKT